VILNLRKTSNNFGSTEARLVSEAELVVQHSQRYASENSFMKTLPLASIHLNEEDALIQWAMSDPSG